MGILTDLLQGVPMNAVLREKVATFEDENAALKTEVAILKDERRKLDTENERLKEQIKILTHIDDLNETQVKILLLLANPNYEHHEQALIEYVSQHPVRVKHHLNELRRINYIYPSSVTHGMIMRDEYYITDNAIAYLVKKNLV